jgi:hypothetical protein
MGALQSIRAYFEVPLITVYSAQAPAIPVYVDNQEYIDCDSTSEFVLLRMNFGAISQQGVMQNFEYVRGTLILEIYSAKGTGPGRGQELAELGIYTLYDTIGHRVGDVMGNFGQIVGPTFSPLNGAPHYLTRLSVPIQGRYYRS